MSQTAAQMYTVREFTKTAKDCLESLKKLEKIGYRAVQLSAVGCFQGNAPEVDAQTMRKMLDDHGMKCIATHCNWDQLVKDIDKMTADLRALGCTYTAIGSAAKHYVDGGAAGYRRLVKDAPPIIAKFKAAGIRFGYHNHAHEFLRDASGLRPIDVLVHEAPKDLFMEIDTYWVAYAGGSPEAYLKKCAGRIDVIHVKDMYMVDRKESYMAPVGEGNLEWDAIIA
ncbi:MAG: sugar phosphate isomerase/epimerase, partial [Candidatus Sumerlaeota bacterium]|nr:sugar phosphate isomerase/epimerase [Candidatus Sumerlaeota bacterium]